MEEKIKTEETEEVLDITAGSIPNELKTYLEMDDSTFEKIEEVLKDLDDKKNNLHEEKETSEKEFEDRLIEFQNKIDKEKEEAFKEFSKREQELDDEKARIEEIKLEEQGKQVNYIDLLNEISDKYNSKINSIEEAIKTCEDNETLEKALDEEKTKLSNALSDEYKIRKDELEKVLKDIGIQIKEEKEEVNSAFDINLDSKPFEEKQQDLLNNNFNNDLNVDTEVVDYEPREDVINEIYESKDIMEGHVFPYLKSIME